MSEDAAIPRREGGAQREDSRGTKQRGAAEGARAERTARPRLNFVGVIARGIGIDHVRHLQRRESVRSPLKMRDAALPARFRKMKIL